MTDVPRLISAARELIGRRPPKQPRLRRDAALQLSGRHSAVYQHADTGRTCSGGTYGRSAYHRPPRLSSCNARDAHGVNGRPTLACALSIDSERPPLGDHVTDPRAPNAKTAVAKNARLTLIVFIPTSSDDQPTIAIRDPPIDLGQ